MPWRSSHPVKVWPGFSLIQRWPRFNQAKSWMKDMTTLSSSWYAYLCCLPNVKKKMWCHTESMWGIHERQTDNVSETVRDANQVNSIRGSIDSPSSPHGGWTYIRNRPSVERRRRGCHRFRPGLKSKIKAGFMFTVYSSKCFCTHLLKDAYRLVERHVRADNQVIF